MKRHLLAALSALSLALLLAAAAMWVRSYRVVDLWYGPLGNEHFMQLTSMGGLVILQIRTAHGGWDSGIVHTTNGSPPSAEQIQTLFLGADWAWLGLSVSHRRMADNTWFTAPFWILVLLFLVAPCFSAISLRRRLRQRRARLQGMIPCPKCGYDLRASTTACPECGAAITTRSSE